MYKIGIIIAVSYLFYTMDGRLARYCLQKYLISSEKGYYVNFKCGYSHLLAQMRAKRPLTDTELVILRSKQRAGHSTRSADICHVLE